MGVQRKAPARKPKRRAGASLTPVLQAAAHLVGSLMSVKDSAAQLGIAPETISTARNELTPRGDEFRQLEAAARDVAIQRLRTKALRTLEVVMETATPRDQVAAVRELTGTIKVDAGIQTDKQRADNDTERVKIEREKASALSDALADGPTFGLMVPLKSKPEPETQSPPSQSE